MMNAENYKHSKITGEILKAYYNVYNALGYGFLEKVYENAMFIELHNTSLKIEKQKPISVYYDEQEVGEYFADLLVEDQVIIELKSAEAIRKEHEFQLINYLRATGLEVGLLLNFGKRPEFKRKVFTYKNPARSVQSASSAFHSK